MSDSETPQIYLVTPPAFEAQTFADLLARVLDAGPLACLRLDLATSDESAQGRAADLVRELGHARDVAVVVARHVGLVERHGLDGVHLIDGARSVRKVRKTLGADRIVGAYCGASRHDGMNAGEAGADYVAFGPVRESGLGDGTLADRDLFTWWSEMIEVPVVAEGVTAETAAALAPATDFVVPDPAFWADEDPVASLARIRAALG